MLTYARAKNVCEETTSSVVGFFRVMRGPIRLKKNQQQQTLHSSSELATYIFSGTTQLEEGYHPCSETPAPPSHGLGWHSHQYSDVERSC